MTYPVKGFNSQYLIKWYFDQEEIWVSHDGTQHKIAEMPGAYMLNCVGMLERISPEIFKEIPLKDQADLNSTEWLQQTRLYKRLKGRLRSMIAKGENPEGKSDEPSAFWKQADVITPRTWQNALNEIQGVQPRAAGGFIRGPARIQFGQATGTTPEPTTTNPDLPPTYDGEINFTDIDEPDIPGGIE